MRSLIQQTFLALTFLVTSFAVTAQESDNATAKVKGSPVVFQKDTLFYIYSNLGPYTAEDRARSVVARLNLLSKDRSLELDSIRGVQNNKSFDIRYKDRIISTITLKDAGSQDLLPEEVVEEHLQLIKSALDKEFRISGVWKIVKEIGLTLLVLLIFFFLIKYVNKLFRFLNIKVHTVKDRFIKGVQIRNYEFLSAEKELQVVMWGMNIIKWLVIILLVYAALPILFSIFPATKGIAETLLGYIWNPFKRMFLSFFSYFPNIITIAVILFITNYVVKFLKFISEEMQAEKFVIPGFYPDWSRPTFNILRFLLYAFSLVIIFPYLPGSDSPIFQGMSVFLGLLVSMGSSSAISNLIAGLVITYMRAFKIGDRVKIGETVGDVLEKTALVTRIRTIKNETITIPNASILTGHTINYSASAKRYELILHTTVTIGYDVPWKQVHELLLQAAKRTDLLLNDPPPFILQTSLDDFYVSYELNAYTEHPKMSALIYSHLHQHIQDLFNEHKIEIMSPHYRANRDGNHVTVPPQYLPNDYKAPSFNVSSKKDGNEH
jgi:small-conductance mechanosensitive channel